jgi:hypothetical protein
MLGLRRPLEERPNSAMLATTEIHRRSLPMAQSSSRGSSSGELAQIDRLRLLTQQALHSARRYLPDVFEDFIGVDAQQIRSLAQTY